MCRDVLKNKQLCKMCRVLQVLATLFVEDKVTTRLAWTSELDSLMHMKKHHTLAASEHAVVSLAN